MRYHTRMERCPRFRNEKPEIVEKEFLDWLNSWGDRGYRARDLEINAGWAGENMYIDAQTRECRGMILFEKELPDVPDAYR